MMWVEYWVEHVDPSQDMFEIWPDALPNGKWKYEIETGDYSYPSIVTSDRCSNLDWAVYQLGFVSDIIFAKGELKGKETFADIYEIVLQNIYLIKVRRY